MDYNQIFSSEALMLSILGVFVLCYHRTLKQCLVSRCTKVAFGCGCVKCEREPVPSENIEAILNIEEGETRM